MDSKIYLLEEVPNKERLFGSQLSYYPCLIIDRSGQDQPALFTRSQVREAVERAKRNPEDIPEDESFWEKLFG